MYKYKKSSDLLRKRQKIWIIELLISPTQQEFIALNTCLSSFSKSDAKIYTINLKHINLGNKTV